jgi:hypothetical protein
MKSLSVLQSIVSASFAPLTKAQALAQPSTIYHRTLRNRDGTALRVRSSGKCQTWKTRPEEFKLPVKYGMYESSYITHATASEWSLEEPDYRR